MEGTKRWSDVSRAWERVLKDLGEIGSDVTDAIATAWQAERPPPESQAERPPPESQAERPPPESQAERPPPEPQAERPAYDPAAPTVAPTSEPGASPASGPAAGADHPDEADARHNGPEPSETVDQLADTVERGLRAMRMAAETVGRDARDKRSGDRLSRSFEAALKITLALLAQVLARFSDRLDDVDEGEARQRSGESRVPADQVSDSTFASGPGTGVNESA